MPVRGTSFVGRGDDSFRNAGGNSQCTKKLLCYVSAVSTADDKVIFRQAIRLECGITGDLTRQGKVTRFPRLWASKMSVPQTWLIADPMHSSV